MYGLLPASQHAVYCGLKMPTGFALLASHAVRRKVSLQLFTVRAAATDCIFFVGDFFFSAKLTRAHEPLHTAG